MSTWPPEGAKIASKIIERITGSLPGHMAVNVFGGYTLEIEHRCITVNLDGRIHMACKSLTAGFFHSGTIFSLSDPKCFEKARKYWNEL